MDTTERENRTGRTSDARFWFGACLLASIAVFLLWEEHRAHILGAIPYLLFLACPLIHLFMHRGHAHGGGEQSGGHRNHPGAQRGAP